MTENKNTNTQKKELAPKKESRTVARHDGYHSFFAPLFNLFDDLPDINDSDYNIMRTDIKDEEDHYLLEMEVPGIKKEDLKIAVRNGYLVVSASFNKKSDEGKGKYIHFERETGSFSRSFYVGENVRTKDVSAKSENGVLLITIPKKVEREDKDEFVQIQ